MTGLGAADHSRQNPRGLLGRYSPAKEAYQTFRQTAKLTLSQSGKLQNDFQRSDTGSQDRQPERLHGYELSRRAGQVRLHWRALPL